MTPLVPLSESATSRAEQLVAVAAAIPPDTAGLPSWEAIRRRAEGHAEPEAQRGGTWRLALAFACSVAVGVVAVSVLRQPPAASDTAPRVELSSGANWSPGTSGAVVLHTGRLSVSRVTPAPIRIETPHVVVEAQGSRFLAEVVASGTFLSVDEGSVVVRAGGLERRLQAGESFTWPPAPEIPTGLLEQPLAAAAQTCTEGAASTRRACLRAEATEDSLEAQAALFELGSLELHEGRPTEAMAAWQESLRRFGDGVLHPEVRLQLVVTLVRQREFSRAATEAKAFLEHCPGDPREGDVKALLERLDRY